MEGPLKMSRLEPRDQIKSDRLRGENYEPTTDFTDFTDHTEEAWNDGLVSSADRQSVIFVPALRRLGEGG